MSWNTVMAIDFDEAACAVYRANFPGVDVRCAPVSELIEQLPDADVIIGGPPCQGFSAAGEGLGEEDERDGWPDFIAAVAKVKPRMFLAENVPGMLTERHIAYFGRILEQLEALGYDVQYRLLDAVSFGVPQFRERVWVWGIRRDLGLKHQWPKPTHVWPPPEPCMFGAELLPAVTVGQALGLNGAIRPSTTLTGNWQGHQQPKIEQYRWSDAMLQKHPPAAPAAPAPTVQAKYFKGGAEGLLAVADEPSYTVSGQSREPIQNWKSKGYCRRLTPLECGRLQSIPDDFKRPQKITKTAMYRVIGNGWSSKCGWIFSQAFHAVDPTMRSVIDLFCGGGLGAVGWHGKFWEYES